MTVCQQIGLTTTVKTLPAGRKSEREIRRLTSNHLTLEAVFSYRILSHISMCKLASANITRLLYFNSFKNNCPQFVFCFNFQRKMKSFALQIGSSWWFHLTTLCSKQLEARWKRHEEKQKNIFLNLSRRRWHTCEHKREREPPMKGQAAGWGDNSESQFLRLLKRC